MNAGALACRITLLAPSGCASRRLSPSLIPELFATFHAVTASVVGCTFSPHPFFEWITGHSSGELCYTQARLRRFFHRRRRILILGC